MSRRLGVDSAPLSVALQARLAAKEDSSTSKIEFDNENLNSTDDIKKDEDDILQEAKDATANYIKTQYAQGFIVIYGLCHIIAALFDTGSAEDVLKSNPLNDEFQLQNPSTMPDQVLFEQPKLFKGKLKSYQVLPNFTFLCFMFSLRA